MSQGTLFPALQPERPPCTCEPLCLNDLCRGECGCEACQWDFDDEAAFQPVYLCCSTCGEVIAIEYEDDMSFPQKSRRAKCCERDYVRIFYGETA